jgi:hypothetical protein
MLRLLLAAVTLLDYLARGLAWAAGKVTPVRGAGVFWMSQGQSFWTVWRERGSWTARLGRLEVIVDLPR